jgi:flagellar protein FlaG
MQEMSFPVAPSAEGQRPAQPFASRQAAAAATPAEGAGAPAGSIEEATPTQIEQAVREANASLQNRSVGVRFEVDHEIDRVIVKVVDRQSGEVIRQIPSEDVVRIARALSKGAGLMARHSA